MADETGTPKTFTFRELLRREDEVLRSPREPELQVRVHGVTVDEPWVATTNRDRFGVSFSGGGIRSATFNLGVLQALAEAEVLQHVDYLSTVSGGGYIGGFFSALALADHSEWPRVHVTPPRAPGVDTLATKLKALVVRVPSPVNFPRGVAREVLLTNHTADEERTRRRSEAPHVRHLRQFSQFLIPRSGFIRFETWAALLAVFGGMVPTLLFATAALGVVACGYVSMMYGMRSVTLMTVAQVAGLAVTLALSELFWRKNQDERPHAYVVTSLIGLSLMLAWLHKFRPAAITLKCTWTEAFKQLASASKPEWPGTHASIAIPWALIGALAMGVYLVTSRFPFHVVHRALLRFASRAFGLAVVWLVFVVLWEAGRWVRVEYTAQFGASGVAAGGLFFWLREWLGQKPEATRLSAITDKLIKVIAPMALQLSALVATIALLVGGLAGLQAFGLAMNTDGDDRVAHWPGLSFLAMCVAVMIITLLVNTSEVGLHGFYRRRIARAFLGARSPRALYPVTLPRDDDDFPITALAAQRPVHLVCCAANDLQGESLQTLGRGARSAVLSAHGLSLGTLARTPDDVSFASALAASGAAVNSQMGSISMSMGRAVAFLTTVLNLRLGLWVTHPRRQMKKWWGALTAGLRLPAEAIGRTYGGLTPDASELWTALRAFEKGTPSPEVVSAASDALGGDKPPALHLSDGGHFENLGLYELIRRHCRYIIVCDAGADPRVAFDDLGNAIRRVREDFGAEIEIDVSGIRPGENGLAKQHVVVGTIRYKGHAYDTGTLLYVKPSCIGDEPSDVLQYRSQNTKFPHEGTADQFYDEAQWESYRRLGHHCLSTALPADDWRKKSINPVEALFLDLRRKWHAAPEHHHETFLSLTARCTALESEVRSDAPLWFRLEVFPELAIAGKEPLPPVGGIDEHNRVVIWVMQFAQLMEDVWVTAKLDTYATHPLYEGWMSYFHRWAATRSFRTWWPVLRSIYSNDFRNFVKRHFALRVGDDAIRGGDERRKPGARLELCDVEAVWARASEMRLSAWQVDQLRYVMTVDASLAPIPVASLDYRADATHVRWNCEDLKVPAWLKGSGVEVRFLERAILALGDRPLVVSIPAEDSAAVAFYKSRGFVLIDERDGRVEVTHRGRRTTS